MKRQTQVQYLIDTIESLFPLDSEYPDTRETGQGILRDIVTAWAWRQLPADWREMPLEILEEYARQSALREFTGYPEAEAEFMEWWEGYKTAKTTEP